MKRFILIILICITIASCGVPKKRITTQNSHLAIQQVVAQYGPQAEANLIPYFQRAGIAYPPQQISILTFKNERNVELWAANNNGDWQYIRTYRMTASSGQSGPKLREFDEQIPEGIYNIVALNPFSSYHLSMLLDYPNSFDLKHAQKEGRTEPGNHIFIHGKASSVGCIAVGDRAINELFVLVARIGKQNAQVIIAPNDFRHHPPLEHPELPNWTPVLYAEIDKKLQPFSLDSITLSNRA